MQTSMAASSPSADSHHAADIPSHDTTVALLSYNIGLLNKEVKRQMMGKEQRKAAEAQGRCQEDLRERNWHSDCVDF